jgi:diguanylate cyclase (GGDEF)-like protein/PAS domain S-box-containing protein
LPCSLAASCELADSDKSDGPATNTLADRNVTDQGGYERRASDGPAAPRPRAAARRKRKRRRIDKLLHELLEHAAVGIVRISEEGRVKEANRAFCMMLGYGRGAVVGEFIDQLVHIDDRIGMQKIRSALCDGTLRTHSGEGRMLHNSGAVVAVRYTVAPVFNRRGEFCDLVSVIEDVTAERHFAEQAAWAEHRYRTVLNALPDHVYVMDAEGCFELANEAWLRAHGISLEELRGRTLHDIFEPEVAALMGEHHRSLLTGRLSSLQHETLATPRSGDGDTRWFLTTKVVLRSSEGAKVAVVGVSRDITERKRAEETLQQSEQQLRVMFDHADVGIALSGPDLRYLRVNDRFSAILGYTPDELRGVHIEQLNLPENVPSLLERRKELLAGKVSSTRRETPLVRKDGSTVWASIGTSLIRRSDGTPLYFMSILQDISEAKRAAAALVESEEQFRQLAAHIPQIFWIADSILGRTIYVSPACETLLGISADRLLRSQRSLVRSIHPEDRRRIYEQRRRASGEAYDETYRVLRPSGEVRWVHDRAFPVRDASGNVYRVAGIAEDITARKHADEQLVRLAHYDALTELPNRTLFLDRLRQALARGIRNDSSVAVMLIDVDRFKYVNDSLGHAAGNRVLAQIAKRLVHCVRADDTVARLGGDEYAIVLNDLSAADDAAVVAAKMIDAFKPPFEFEDTELFVSASIGITLAPDDAGDPDTLIRQADTAMYRAKARGRNNFQFYEPEMSARSREILGLERDLRRAIEAGEFIIHYQPKVSLDSAVITGVEALMRWKHPLKGLVSPAEFIPVLEDTGLIIAAGAHVLEVVCEQMNEWRRLGISNIPVAVNLSPRQFVAPDLGQSVGATLEKYGVPPELFEIEITESAIMLDPEDAVRTLRYLKSLGVSIAIDDFGTGYSSLANLKRFPLSTLKVDQSFIRDITVDGDDAAITQAVVSMGHSLSLSVVAEGVETRKQFELLKAFGCDAAQGYLFSKPIPGDECARFIATYPGLP